MHPEGAPLLLGAARECDPFRVWMWVCPRVPAFHAGLTSSTPLGSEVGKMKLATPEAKARGVYAILFILSLPVPLFHHQALGDALWAVRFCWGLHPIQNLGLWHLGRLSVALPVTLLALLIASWRWTGLCAPTMLVRVAVGVCLFTVLYAMACALALWMALGLY